MRRNKEANELIGPDVDHAKLLLSYRNALQTCAQLRKAQSNFYKARDGKQREKFLVELRRLETAVDMRLSQLEIKAVES